MFPDFRTLIIKKRRKTNQCFVFTYDVLIYVK